MSIMEFIPVHARFSVSQVYIGCQFRFSVKGANVGEQRMHWVWKSRSVIILGNKSQDHHWISGWIIIFGFLFRILVSELFFGFHCVVIILRFFLGKPFWIVFFKIIFGCCWCLSLVWYQHYFHEFKFFLVYIVMVHG